MDHLKQPKRELLLQIKLEGDDTAYKYKVFLGEFSRIRPGSQTPEEFFNEANQYIPARNIDSDQMEFLNKKKILWAKFDLINDDESDDHIPGTIKNIIVRMEGGTLNGTVEIMLPPERSRITDFINQDDRFFLLTTEEGCYVINKDQVGSVSD